MPEKMFFFSRWWLPLPCLFREEEEGGEGELVEKELQSRTGDDSPLSVDSLSGIYLGFSEKEKKEEKEVAEESSYVIEDDLKIEEEESIEKECLKSPSEKISRPHVLAHFFRPKQRSKPRIVEEAEVEEAATSCFRLFRRTLNITDYDGWF